MSGLPERAKRVDRGQSWSVSFEINVPRNAMLTLTTNNGGIAIDDFRGTAKFHANNGGLALHHVGGDLRGETTNERRRDARCDPLLPDRQPG